MLPPEPPSWAIAGGIELDETPEDQAEEVRRRNLRPGIGEPEYWEQQIQEALPGYSVWGGDPAPDRP